MVNKRILLSNILFYYELFQYRYLVKHFLHDIRVNMKLLYVKTNIVMVSTVYLRLGWGKWVCLLSGSAHPPPYPAVQTTPTLLAPSQP